MADRANTARLLLVDDNRDNLDVLAMLLGERYDVVSCGSAAEAFSALESSPVDLLVLDIGMTPIDGLECLEAIRALPGYRHTPAIALTAFARETERETFLAGGFQAVVTKPLLDHQALEALIDRLLADSSPTPCNGASDVPDGNLLTHSDPGRMLAGRGPGKHRAPSPS